MTSTHRAQHWHTHARVITYIYYVVQVPVFFVFIELRSTLHSIIREGTLEPCLVLSTCLIALVVVAVNITKSKNIIVGHVDNTK